MQNQASMPQLSDRSFIFISLLLAIVGSSLLINYKDVGPLTTIGLTVLGMSLVIGVKSIIDLYAKLIGVSSLLGETLGTSTNPDDNLHIQQHSLPQRKSVGWYLGLAALFSVLFRVATPQITSYLLLHGGASAIFWQTLCVNCLTLLIFLLKFDSLQPHQSYLILKQREMISYGLDDKDLRLLDTIENIIPNAFESMQGGLHSSQ